MKIPDAHIVAIGSELLHSGRVDTNSLFISDSLAQCGIKVRRKLVLGDNQAEIRAALRASVKQTQVVVVTGGLGSTVDDCTREAIAAVVQRPLKVRRKAQEILKRQVEARGRSVTSILAKQAMIPAGGIVLDNVVGTAPGFYVQSGGSHVFVLPGVPREAREMMEHQVQPILKRKFQTAVFFWSHAFNTIGLPETDIQHRVLPLLADSTNMTLSLLASIRGVKVTLSCWRPDQQISSRPKVPAVFSETNALIDEVRQALAPWLISEGEQSMEGVVSELLTARGWRLAIAESCTGGLIANRLTDVPGSSVYLDRSVVTYSNDAKRELLGVSAGMLKKHGAVSIQVAEAMAKGIRAKSHADLGVSVTGIAGPDGGSIKKPVGLVYMALDGARGQRSQRCQFFGNRTEIKFRSSQAALDMIRRYCLRAHS